jgi:Ca2+-binding RTX toxin-like protein
MPALTDTAIGGPGTDATVFLADPPTLALATSATPPALILATADAMVWRQTFTIDGVSVVNDVQYIGSFTYGDAQRPQFTAAGVVTEIKTIFNNDAVTLDWRGFSTTLAVLDEADSTPGGWDSFYKTVLLPGNDVLVSTRHLAEGLNGYDGNDTIQSGPGNDRIEGGLGRDQLSGGDGNDHIAGGQFGDVDSGAGEWDLGGPAVSGDIVFGNSGDDTCEGGAGPDVMRGGQGDDLITGAAGNDWLSGDRGDDTLTGGAGADIFHSFVGAGVDRVTDFNAAQGDRILVDAGTAFTVNQVGSDAIIETAGGGHVVLVGVAVSSLTGDWIVVG